MDAFLPVNARVSIPLGEVRVSFSRSGGPGGQNVNKVETQVEVRWTPAASRALGEEDRAWLLAKLAGRLRGEGELIVVSSRFRTQAANREDALERLAGTVRAALVRPRRRRKTRPSRAAQQRRLDAKKANARKKASRRWSGD